MRILSAFVMAAISMGVASCGGDAQPSSNSAVAINPPPQSPNIASRSAAPRNGAPAAPATNKPDSPPADAQYMIYCDVIRGPDHVQQAMLLKQELIKQTNREGWHVIHGTDESTLYYGYYRTFEDAEHDPQETARAQADRRFVETLPDPLGDRRFRASMFVPASSPDPEAPPEWNLANAPADAFWSLQIGAYQGIPERKQEAVDLVRQLRTAGQKAYYYHGETISSVCIGVWPRSAVREQGTRDDAHTADPSQPILVLSDKIPTGINPVTYDKEGNRVLIVGPKLDILDESLKQAIKDFPDHERNGQYYGKISNGTTIRDPSFLVYVPHDLGASSPATPANSQDAAREAVRAGANDAATAIVTPQAGQPQPQQPARLRSIGDQ